MIWGLKSKPLQNNSEKMGFLRGASIPGTQFAHLENEGCKNSK